MAKGTRLYSLITLALAAGSLSAGQPVAEHLRVTQPVVENDRVLLTGNVHHLLANRIPTQHTDYAKPMERQKGVVYFRYKIR